MRPTSSLPKTGNRPNLALRLEQTVKVAETVRDQVHPSADLPVADLVAAAGTALHDDTRTDAGDIVTAAVLARAVGLVTSTLERAVDLTPLPGTVSLDDLASGDGLSLVCAHAGIDLPAGVAASAACLAHRDPRATAYATMAGMVQLRSHLRSTHARRSVRRVWDCVDSRAELDDPGALDARITVHTHAGIDAERFVWSAIVHESRKHTGLIWHEANKLTRNRAETPEDMLGYGWQGLRAALRSYDPSQAALATYACPRINGAIRSGLRSELPYSKRSSDLINAAARAEEKLVHELSRAPTLPELAAKLGESLEVLKKLPALQPTASIEELTVYDDGDRASSSSWLADPADVAGEVLTQLACDEIRDALAQLPADEAAAVQLVVLDAYRPAEAAAVLDIDTRRLRTLKNRGLQTLAGSLAHLAV